MVNKSRRSHSPITARQFLRGHFTAFSESVHPLLTVSTVVGGAPSSIGGPIIITIVITITTTIIIRGVIGAIGAPLWRVLAIALRLIVSVALAVARLKCTLWSVAIVSGRAPDTLKIVRR